MTCENCMHRPVCALRIHWGVGSDWNNRYTPDVEKRCKSFKNEAEIIKGFAEKLKKKVSRTEQPWEEPCIFASDIDEVLKEIEVMQNDT